MHSHSTSLLVGLGLFVLSCLGWVRPGCAGQHCVVCEEPSATYLCAAENGPGILAANGGQLLCIREMAKRGGHEKCAIMRGNASRCDGLAPTVLYPDMSDSEFEAADAPPDVGPPPPPPPPETAPHTPVRNPGDRVHPAQTDDTYLPDDDGLTERDGNRVNDPQHAGDQPKPPPKTVVEMADRAYETSKKGVNDAGDAVTETAKSAGKVVSDTAKKTGEQIGKAGKAIGDGAKKVWTCMTSLFSDC